MQHIVHIFIGNDLIDFAKKFSSFYRKQNTDQEPSLFSVISLVEDEEGKYLLSTDEDGDKLDNAVIEKRERINILYNYFEDLYRRKVTVAHPGNQSMIVILWAKLYLDDSFTIIKEITEGIELSNSRFQIEISGFTHDSVSCFIQNPLDRLSPDIYKNNFDKNIERLLEKRPKFSSLRLIANRNMDNVALDLDEDSMVRICSVYADLLCKHYLSFSRTVVDFREFPFESFGISAIRFDLEYYKTYIKNRLIIDKMIRQDVEGRKYNLNALAQTTNPALKKIMVEIQEFKDKQAANAKASLSLSGNATTSNIVGTIDTEIKDIIRRLEVEIEQLLSTGEISIFECEALLSLILGEDSNMFYSSAVDAQEATIEDIINDAADYFIRLDEEKEKLRDVSQDDIKKIRKRMRNIAVSNRQREDRLKSLKAQINNTDSERKHLNNDSYEFGGREYQVNLNIDTEPLEHRYDAHEVTIDGINLSNKFAPIRNQGKQGCCASFAVSSVIESMRGDGYRYSPAFLYWSAREINGATAKDAGASLYDVIRAATVKGVCTEENMPYNAEIFTLAPSEVAAKEAMSCMIVEAKSVEPKLQDIKSALSDGYPVIVASKIFDSFSDTRSGFVKHPSNQEISNGQRKDGHGNHAMVVCGFSDKEKIFIVRNSWGTEFGVNGYCYIPYSYAQQFFLQACIITKLSTTDRTNSIGGNKTISFNLNDSNIEAAILQNLIDEDNYELQELAEESGNLRSDWAHNVAVLGNVNNQSEIIKKAQDKIDEDIAEKNRMISDLQAAMGDKIREFKHKYIIWILQVGFIAVVLWIITFYFPKMIWFILSSIFTSCLIAIIGAYSYRWRKYRQELRDEIQAIANHIERLRQEKLDLDIKSHIYGTILRETENYRLELFNKFQLLKRFNREWIELYNLTRKVQGKMTPEVPYPFLSVLENELLERYYSAWSHRMIDALDLKAIFNDYKNKENLNEILKSNSNLNNSIVRGLRNFSMKEYIIRTNANKWQFLPETSKMEDVIPALDARATPFCPYNQTDNNLEKYIFINDISQEEMTDISRYFTFTPLAIKKSDPYSISIVNILRYDLESIR